MREEMNIQWFPGHMTKALRMIAENLKLVDAVCEIVDARIPLSSRNPDFDDLLHGKPKLIILNRADQADTGATKQWAAFLKSGDLAVIETDSKSGAGVSGFTNAIYSLLRDKLAYYMSKGQTGRQLRAMIVGIPNVGKSSFINRAANRKAAEAFDKPGVTRGKQWISIDKSLELLDTPGVLWQKFTDQTVAENLAFTGAIRDEVIDIGTLGANFMLRMKELYPERLAQRYKVDAKAEDNGFDILEKAAKNRGFLISGGGYDLDRMAAVALDEFRAGKLGRITLEQIDIKRPQRTVATARSDG